VQPRSAAGSSHRRPPLGIPRKSDSGGRRNHQQQHQRNDDPDKIVDHDQRVPLLHVIVIWTRPSYRLDPFDYVVVGLQAVIFAFALQIRSPVVWAVLALSTFWLMTGALALRRGRSLRSLCDWRQSRSALIPITVLAVLFSAQLLAAVTLHPLYRAQGDVPRHTFWQGMLSSLQLNPEWRVKYLPSVDNYIGDMMPEEVARVAIMKLSPGERQEYLRSDGWPKRTALEKFTRLAFFDFLRSDPKFVAHAFFIDKPAWVRRSERIFFGGLFSGLPIWNTLIPAAAVVFLVVLVAWNADAQATLLPTAGVIPLFIIVSWLPNWLVLPNGSKRAEESGILQIDAGAVEKGAGTVEIHEIGADDHIKRQRHRHDGGHGTDAAPVTNAVKQERYRHDDEVKVGQRRDVQPKSPKRQVIISAEPGVFSGKTDEIDILAVDVGWRRWRQIDGLSLL